MYPGLIFSHLDIHYCKHRMTSIISVSHSKLQEEHSLITLLFQIIRKHHLNISCILLNNYYHTHFQDPTLSSASVTPTTDVDMVAMFVGRKLQGTSVA